MDFVTGIKERRSIRKFQDKKVPREVIEQIVEVARYAPSWKNSQTAGYVVIDDKDKIAVLAGEKCTAGFDKNSATIMRAPAAVILIYKKGICGYNDDGSFTTAKEDRWEMFDAGIAAQTFCLAAHEKGIGSVIMGIFDEAEVKKAFDISDEYGVGAIIPIGYAEVQPDVRPRKEVSELLKFI